MGKLCDQTLLFLTIASATWSRVFLYPRTFYCIGFTCIAAGLLEPDPPTWVVATRLAAAATPFIPPRLPQTFQIAFELLAVSLGLTVAVIPIFEHSTNAVWLTSLFFVAGCAIDALNRYALRLV